MSLPIRSEEEQLLKHSASQYEPVTDGHQHYSHRSPWLRAFILGADDGLVSVAALMLGMGGGSEDLHTMDTEEADVQKERDAQAKGPAVQKAELEELTQIYMDRGLSPDLARHVAEELTAKDVIRAHARDELGIDLDDMSNPVQAAVVSCLTFTAGASIPLLAGAFVEDYQSRLISVFITSTIGLALLGYLGAVLRGAKVMVGTMRVLIGGLLAFAITFGVGYAFGVTAG